MTIKQRNIIGWSLSGLVGLALIASATDKIMGTQHALATSASFGISGGVYAILGIIEIISVLLFIYPKTGILGLLLLSSYLGAAIATHLQHGQNSIFPAVFEAVVWIAAVFRFPEVTSRILNK